ncbi:hypothetical protein GpartN1_g3540.t1 [Galdieria partita]|uniref:FCP1 homology domain-containing protein n=1 Tax=Galdieria partita TaxID=83374 RepID=A0A9C7PX02_9RHOD|nr:hypothetical protein GpartN1_g3540.t1 [Galdieria partita]
MERQSTSGNKQAANKQTLSSSTKDDSSVPLLVKLFRLCCASNSNEDDSSVKLQAEVTKDEHSNFRLKAGEPRRVHVIEYYEGEEKTTKDKHQPKRDSLQLQIDSEEGTNKDGEELQDGDSIRQDTIPTPRPVGHSTSIYITAMPSEWQEETKYANNKHVWVSSPTHPHYRKRVRNFELNPVTEHAASEKRKSSYFLPPQTEEMKEKKTLVLDLDETLVHSGFEGSRETSDFVLSMHVENTYLQLFVKMRPYLKEFLQEVTKHFEIVIFTASMLTYADPVIDLMFDATGVASIPETHRLFRESCEYDPETGSFHKDLMALGRDIKKVIIVDNSPTAYAKNPHNAIPIPTWIDDENDHSLLDVLSILKTLIPVQDVRTVLKQLKEQNEELDKQESQNKHS